MKKTLCLLCLLVLFVWFSPVSPCYGFSWIWTTGELDYATQVAGTNSYYMGVLVTTDGTNDATCTVYDNTTGSGKIVASIKVVGVDNYGGENLPHPIRAATGIYISPSGTGAKCNVRYLNDLR